MCYRVQFRICTNGGVTIDAKQHITFDTYQEILRLNDDMLDDIKLEEVPGEPNSRYLMMQIKPVAQGLGINGKYVISKIQPDSPSG